MALLCGRCDRDIIMLVGRWHSDAMMRYLHQDAQPIMQKLAVKMFNNGTYSFHPSETVPIFRAGPPPNAPAGADADADADANAAGAVGGSVAPAAAVAPPTTTVAAVAPLGVRRSLRQRGAPPARLSVDTRLPTALRPHNTSPR